MGLRVRSGVTFARTRRSRTFETFGSRDIGRWDVAILGYLSGFKIRIIVAILHTAGITLNFSDRLKILVRALRAMGPRCFKWP